jgi:hypothetical protein
VRPAGIVASDVEPLRIHIGQPGKIVGSGEDIVDLVVEHGEVARQAVLATQDWHQDDEASVTERLRLVAASAVWLLVLVVRIVRSRHSRRGDPRGDKK